jgi:acetoin utilization deacetylase AcuC-like enzyme
MEQQPLQRGALQWIRRLAGKRAVWVSVQAARLLKPPPEAYDREGVFYVVGPPFHHAATNGT